MSLNRYDRGGTTERNGNLTGWWERKVWRRDNSDTVFIIPSEFALRPDLLAYDVYGKSELMWAILQYNNIIDIASEFAEGQTILLPTRNRLLTELLS